MAAGADAYGIEIAPDENDALILAIAVCIDQWAATETRARGERQTSRIPRPSSPIRTPPDRRARRGASP